jgi:excisionase family DNA binding protein
MRYRVVVSRVQVAERHVRAVNEEEAIKRIQAELDRPYGFLGSWRTTNTDIDVTEAERALETSPPQVSDEGRTLLTIKEAAAHLGVSYGTLYELVNTAEIAHVAIGRRKYISREDLKSFIESHTRLGTSPR